MKICDLEQMIKTAKQYCEKNSLDPKFIDIAISFPPPDEHIGIIDIDTVCDINPDVAYTNQKNLLHFLDYSCLSDEKRSFTGKHKYQKNPLLCEFLDQEITKIKLVEELKQAINQTPEESYFVAVIYKFGVGKYLLQYSCYLEQKNIKNMKGPLSIRYDLGTKFVYTKKCPVSRAEFLVKGGQKLSKNAINRIIKAVL